MNFTFVTLMPAAAAARSFDRTASICWPSVLRRTLATSRHSATDRDEVHEAEDRAGELAVETRGSRRGPEVEPEQGRLRPASRRCRPPSARWRTRTARWRRRRRCVTTARLTPRTRSADAPTVTSPTTTAATEPMIGPQREPDARVHDEVRDREAAHARQGDLGERHLADEAGDHDQRQADDDADQRQHEAPGGSRTAARSGATRRSCAAPPSARPGAGPRRGRQPLLDQLAARRQVRPSQRNGGDDDQEDEQGLDAGERVAACSWGTRSASRRSTSTTGRSPMQQPG